jgi:hypothetical protein
MDVREELVGTPSTMPATAGASRAAFGAMAVSAVIFLAVAPFAKVQLPAVVPFLPAYQSALVVTDVVTAVLLYGQFAIVGSRALLVLASGYVFCALMAIAHALSFPGLFAEGGLVSGGAQTTAWIYFLWHGVFPLFIVFYALANGTRWGKPMGAIPFSLAATFALALALTLLTTLGHDALPVIMRGDLDASTSPRQHGR